MIEARRASRWRDRYELIANGESLGMWDGRVWRSGGSLTLAGQRYDVRPNTWGSRYEMTDQAGTVIAAADRVGRRRWTLQSGGRIYQFQRASWWRSEEHLMADDQPVGSIRRVSVWRSDAVADLPGLPVPLQVFVLVVVLTKWNEQASAGASSGT